MVKQDKKKREGSFLELKDQVRRVEAEVGRCFLDLMDLAPRQMIKIRIQKIKV